MPEVQSQPVRYLGALVVIGLALLGCAVAWGTTRAVVAQNKVEIDRNRERDKEESDRNRERDEEMSRLLFSIDKNQVALTEKFEALEKRIP